MDEVDAIVKGLGDIDFGGKLQYHHASGQNAPMGEPALNLPDANEPLLKNLRCLEDITEHGHAISKKVIQQGGGAGGTDAAGRSRSNPLLEKLNRRLAYIQEHNIQLADLLRLGLDPKPAESKPAPARQPIFVAPPEVSEAHALVDAMTLADIATVTSGLGRRGALDKKKDRLHADITQMRANGESAASVLQKTKDAIKKSGSGSIGN